MLVRQMRAPQRQAVLPVKSARERAREVQAGEGKVLDNRYIRAAQHLVVQREIAAGGHDAAPARMMPLVRVLPNPLDQLIAQIGQRRAVFDGLDRRGVVQAVTVALAEIIAQIVLAADPAHFRDLSGRGFRIDQRRIYAPLFRLADEAHEPRAEAIPVLFKNRRVFLLRQVFASLPVGRGNIYADFVQRIKPLVDQTRRKAARAAPYLRQIALVVRYNLIDHFHGAKILTLPAVMADHCAQKRVRVRGIDARSHEYALRRQLDFFHTFSPFSFFHSSS